MDKTKRTLALVIVLSSCFYGHSQTKNAADYKTTKTGFVENKGQLTDQDHQPNPAVKYLLSSPGFNIQLRQTGFSYDTYTEEIKNEKQKIKSKGELLPYTRHYHRVDIELQGCNTNAQLVAEGPSDSYTNYVDPSSPQGGVTGIFSYKKVTYKNIYPNIDLEFMVSASKPGSVPAEYQFVVHPGGNTADIKLAYSGANETHLENKALIVNVAAGDFSEVIPSSYWADTKRPVQVNYSALGNNTYGFSVSHSSLSTFNSDLIIDPVPNLLWGTYYGAGGGLDGDQGLAIALDAAGNVYITGFTQSTTNIATAGSYQVTYSTANYSAYVAKFNNTGSSLLWATYYGGDHYAEGLGIAVDAGDNVYVTGNTGSLTGIATAGAYKATYGGPAPNAFVAKFNPTGTSLIWGTYFGNSETTSFGIRLDATDNVYIAGSTSSTTGIATPGAYKSVMSGGLDAYVAKLDPTGSTLLWGTYYGTLTTCLALALDRNNNAYITGSTSGTTGIATPGAYKTTYTPGATSSSFVAKISSNGSTLDWGTYYGGSTTCIDQAYSIAVDTNNNAYITGQTQTHTGIATPGAYKTVFTASPGSFTAFVAKFNATGSNLDWGTYYGGAGDDEGYGIALDANNNSYITGWTFSNFGIATPNAYQTLLGAGAFGNCFIAKFDPAGSNLLWGSYYGGTSWDISMAIALNPCNDVFITGQAGSTSGIATPGAYQTTLLGSGNDNGFVAEFDSTGTSSLAITVSNKPALCNGSNTGTAIETTTAGVAFTYSWSPGGQTTDTATGLSAGTYTVTVRDVCGNTATASTTITQPSPLVPSATASGSCNVATASATGGTGPYTYLWTPGGLTSANATGLSAGTYTVTVTDSNHCSQDTTVTLSGGTVLSITAKGDTTICAGVSVKLIGSAPAATSPLSWNPGNLSGDTITVMPKTTTTYTVTGSNECGTNTDTVTVKVLSSPVVSFTASPQTTSILAPSIQFTNTTNPGGIAQWSWHFGDSADSVSPMQNAAHTYSDTGRFCITLIATNTLGCTDSATNCIEIYPSFAFYIPSAFSPNGDGKNEIFLPEGNDVASMQMYIFDRWGNVVFTTTDPAIGWNGTNHGVYCSQDAYIYEITVFDSRNREYDYTGDVNLIR